MPKKPVYNKLSRPIKWHGGKHYLTKEIISRFPRHIHYVEPYFGGGAVLFDKPIDMILAHSEVVNDINGELMNFWQVLAYEEGFNDLLRLLTMTPFSQNEFFQSTLDTGGCDVHRARKFFIRYRQSRQGLGRSFATLSKTRTRRGMNEQVSSWLSAIDGLPQAHDRLKRVVILCDDALKVIKAEDGPGTFFYLDPPYLHSTRTAKQCYEHEMSDDDHAALLDLLGRIQGKFILSGYRSKLYDSMAHRCEWRRVDIQIDNKASSKDDKPIKTECLWLNY